MTADTEKLKALALAAQEAAEAMGAWPNVYQLADGIVLDQFAEFMVAFTPAVALELFAQAEFAKKECSISDFARRKFAGRVDELEAEVERLRAEVDCRGRAQGGNTNSGFLQKFASERYGKPVASGSAPAAGTEKDAEVAK